jgi:hypothetical protein
MGKRRSRGCSRGTHSSSGGCRRRNCRSLNKVRLICSILSIRYELHVSLVVANPLNEWCIDHIRSSMVQHEHKLCSEGGTNTWWRRVISNCLD